MQNNLCWSCNPLQRLFVKIKFRNKNNSISLCLAYQPCSNKARKLGCPDKFEVLLANVYATWNGALIVTKDFNMNLLGNQESVERCNNILYTISLKQHVTNETRKGKTLIDHISSNISSKLIHCEVTNTDEIYDHDTPYTLFYIKKERFVRQYN